MDSECFWLSVVFCFYSRLCTFSRWPKNKPLVSSYFDSAEPWVPNPNIWVYLFVFRIWTPHNVGFLLKHARKVVPHRENARVADFAAEKDGGEIVMAKKVLPNPSPQPHFAHQTLGRPKGYRSSFPLTRFIQVFRRFGKVRQT